MSVPDEEDFRQEVLVFLRSTLAEKGAAATSRERRDRGGAGRRLPARAGRSRLGRNRVAGRVRRTWIAQQVSAHLRRRGQGLSGPSRALEIGLGMCGPTLLVHASDEQKRALIPPLLRGEHVWCELFSEPGAGSDLSSVQTRARLDGSEFVVDGQKVWTSGAQHSDYAACLTRSDPARPKREGITMLIVDMHTPGITVRPLRQITGETHFNEVFLDGVRVPAANVLGEVHDGWRVARTMLAFERQALGALGSGGGGKGGFAALVAEATRRGLAARPEVRDRLVQLRIRQMVLGHLAGTSGRRHGAGTARRPRCSSWPWRSWCRSRRSSRSRSRACGAPPGAQRPRRWTLVRPTAQLAVGLHRGRHERDRAQRHRRTCPRPAPRRGGRPHAGRPGRPRPRWNGRRGDASGTGRW